MNPLKELHNFGQSFWYDNIRRGLIDSGELKKMIDEDGLRGITSNPTIFEKAISGGTDYDDAIRALVGKRKSVPDIFDELSVADIRMAADLFRPVYDAAGGHDGLVSIEVGPQYANDSDATIAEARRLWKLVERPNVMVKIPATQAGIPAIEQCLYEGININITLIFAVERYEQVIHAYRRALERRAKENKPVDRVASVASFFVSRIDTAVDKILQEKIQASQSGREKDALLELIGKVAIANAKAAYQLFKKSFSEPWFEALKQKGARVQRPLWASTSTKNPNYRDVIYVEELIGPDTVNTLPPATVTAFRDHGLLRNSLEENFEAAKEVLDKLKLVGVDLKKVTVQLEKEGVKSFADSYEKLLQCLTAKKEMIQATRTAGRKAELGAWDGSVKEALETLEREKAGERIWSRDGSLWKSDGAAQSSIRQRLGWLDLPSVLAGQAANLMNFAAEMKKAGFTQAVLLGMGGSSLAPEVCRRIFGSKKSPVPLTVLDTTDPAAILEAERLADPEKILFLVSSKSGTTIEVHSLFKYFYARVQAVKKDKAGENFVAITDPDTPLEKLAREKHFRRIFSAPADVGGRYSALTYFGLVPAALLGVDIKTFLERADRMASGCASFVRPSDNPALRLGAALAALAKEGRDKLTFVLSPEIASFGIWAEQLIAESLGKEGKGVVPIDEEPLAPTSQYGRDRVFIFMTLEGSKDAALEGKADELESAGFPVIRLRLTDTLDLAQEFYRWEMAVAAAGALMGVNPFDEPNVSESKNNTNKILDQHRTLGRLPEDGPLLDEDGIRLWADDATAQAIADSGSKNIPDILASFWSRAREGDYAALMAYVSPAKTNHEVLQKLRLRARDMGRCATTLGYGPRFLHSTGQLHKGGPNTGIFLQITMKDETDPTIPEVIYGFSTLKNAQALGDFQSLKAHGRRVIRLHFSAGFPAALEKIVSSLQKVQSPA